MVKNKRKTKHKTMIIGNKKYKVRVEKPYRVYFERVKSNRKLLTRGEMWCAIKKKYPSLRFFNIDRILTTNAMKGVSLVGTYYSREMLLNMVFEMKIHKSRHLNKEQKQKIKYEIELNKLKRIENKI